MGTWRAASTEEMITVAPTIPLKALFTGCGTFVIEKKDNEWTLGGWKLSKGGRTNGELVWVDPDREITWEPLTVESGTEAEPKFVGTWLASNRLVITVRSNLKACSPNFPKPKQIKKEGNEWHFGAWKLSEKGRAHGVLVWVLPEGGEITWRPVVEAEKKFVGTAPVAPSRVLLNSRSIANYYDKLKLHKKKPWDLVQQVVEYYRDRGFEVYLAVRDNFVPPDEYKFPGVHLVTLSEGKDRMDLAILLKAHELKCPFVDNCSYKKKEVVERDTSSELSEWSQGMHVTFYFDTEGKFNPLRRVDATSGEASDDDRDAPSSSAGLPESRSEHVVLNCANIGEYYLGKPSRTTPAEPMPRHDNGPAPKRPPEDATLFWQGVRKAFDCYSEVGIRVHLVVRWGDALDCKDYLREREDMLKSIIIVPPSGGAMKANDDLVTLLEAKKWKCEYVDNDQYDSWSWRGCLAAMKDLPSPRLADWFEDYDESLHVYFRFERGSDTKFVIRDSLQDMEGGRRELVEQVCVMLRESVDFYNFYMAKIWVAERHSKDPKECSAKELREVLNIFFGDECNHRD